MWLRIILCAIALLQVSECLVNPCKKGLKSTQFFAHPEAADKYIQCSMFGQMFVFSCPPGLVWKQEKTACDLKSFVSIFSIPSTTTAQTPSSNIDSGSAPSARIVAPPQVVPQVVPQTVPQQVQQQTFEQPPMQPQVQQQQVQQQQQPQQQKFQQPQQVQQPMKVQQQQQQFQQPQQVQQPMQVQQQAPQQPKQLQQQEFRSQQQEIQQLQQQLQKEQQQLQQQPMPTTGPSSTQFAPIATTVSSTTSTTTTTTTTPVPVPLPTANQQVVTPVGNTVVSSPAVSTPSVSGGRCDSVSVSGSVFNIVNGVYSKLPSSASIYRRSDNLQLPGLLVKTSDQQWCVTFSFSTVDFNTLTVPDVLSRCGAGLDCCMLISEPASTATAGIAEIDDPSAVWIANILENRGKQDASIKFTCETTVKACTKVPFCPPECQGTRDGCDICECNGVPFFKIQSSELSSFGGAQQPQQQQQTPVVQQQTPQIPQQIPQQVQQQQVPQQQVPQQQVPQQQVPQQQVQQQQVPQQQVQQQQVQQQQVQQQQVQQQQVQQQVQQQIQQQPQMQPQPSTRPNPVVAPSTMQPTTQPQRPVTKVVQPATMQPQIIQEEQFRPTFIQNPHQEQQQQQQLQLQQQELQTLNELDKTVHQAQSPAAQANSVSQFANRVEAIEKQQLQNQVDQLNRLIASAKTPSQPVTRPMFPGQQPVDVNAQQSQKIVQSFPQPQPQQPLTDMNHFVNTIPVRQPTQQQQQQQTMQSGLTERQRQELLMQQRKQQDIIARQQQEQLVRQEQEQRMLQQQFKQLQQQKTPGITTLSSRKFAARLPQPMAHMNQVKVLALNATSNQTEIQPTQPIHFEQQQQQMPVQPVPTPVVEASVAQPAPSVQPQQVKPQHVQSQQQQQQHPTIQPIQPTQQLIQPFQPIQQQQPQQPQQKVHTPIKPVMTVDQTGPTTTRMNSGVFVDQQRQSPSSKQFNSPSLNKAIEFNRQNMHKTLFQPMIKSIPITKCNVVQCGKNMVCREIRDCPMCSPMCLPQDPTEINLGHVITCENIKCPVPFKCVKSTFDHSVKCEV